MKSSIKIDFIDNGAGKGLEPIIKVSLVSTNDPRDKLLATFFQSMGGESSWLSVKFEGYTGGIECEQTTYINIYPVTPNELKETSDIITARLRELGKSSGYTNNNYTLPELKEQ